MVVQRWSRADPVQVGDEPFFGESLTWCGRQLILEATDGRLIKEGRRLVATQDPEWTVQPLTILAGDIYSDPLCAPDGDAVAAIAFPVYPRRQNNTARITILGLGQTAGSDSLIQGGEYRNPSEWSSNGEWVMVEATRFDTGTISLRLQGSAGQSGLTLPRIQLIDLGEEAETLGPLTYDWYQPSG